MKDDRSRSICLLQTINRNMRRCVEKKVAGTGVFRSQHKLLMTLGIAMVATALEIFILLIKSFSFMILCILSVFFFII